MLSCNSLSLFKFEHLAKGFKFQQICSKDQHLIILRTPAAFFIIYFKVVDFIGV